MSVDAVGEPVPGRYRHFKGKTYRVFNVASHSETEERLVVYAREESPDVWWVRPVSMFVEPVERDGYSGARFVRIGD